MPVGRLALRLALVLALLGAGDLLLERLTLADDDFLGRPVAPFDPPLFSSSQRQALARIEEGLAAPSELRPDAGKFDAQLGWCNKPGSGFGQFRYDWAGARIGLVPLARTKTPGVRRVVALGCSMTHGEEVPAGQAWCARLDERSDELEIANLGVAAYGIDQALLRLRRDGWILQPDEVWLGVLPQAALRVTTLFRPLLDHWSLDVAFKPRFELDPRGELALLPNPASSLASAARLLRDQPALLDALGGHDPWVARAPLAYAPRGTSWTHASFVGRLFLTLWERGGREVGSCFDESTEFGQLYTAIVRATARECAERGVTFRLLILPARADLQERALHGRGAWEAWADRLRSEGVQVFDLAPALEAGDPERLFAPGGHYTGEASELVANALLTGLARQP